MGDKIKNSKIEINKNVLIDLYCKERMSLQKIVNIFNCKAVTIQRRLIENSINRRDKYESRRKLNLSKMEIR